MGEKEVYAPRISTFVITGDVRDKILYDGSDRHFCKGKGAVKVTIEVSSQYSAGEVVECLSDIFQRTILSFQQFS